METQFIYKTMINDKKMKPTNCWSYGLKDYSDFSKKYTCDYTSEQLLEDIQQKGIQNNYEEVFYVLTNNRTYVSMQYRLLDNDPIYKLIIGWVKISAFGEATKETKDSGF